MIKRVWYDGYQSETILYEKVSIHRVHFAMVRGHSSVGSTIEKDR